MRRKLMSEDIVIAWPSMLTRWKFCYPMRVWNKYWMHSCSVKRTGFERNDEEFLRLDNSRFQKWSFVIIFIDYLVTPERSYSHFKSQWL